MLGHVRSNAVAYLALFVALGGTSYAAAKLPRNSVGAKQIRTGAVRSAEVKNGVLRARDFRPGELPAGPRGAQGERGAVGPTFGSADVDAAGAPAAAPDGITVDTYNFTLPTAGPTYVRVLLSHHGADCTAGGARLGLYVDGAPVAGTDVFFPPISDAQARELVAIVNLAPGVHVGAARSNCPGGDPAGATFGGPETWTVLLLGGT